MTIAELIADKFAQQIDPRNVTPTQNMILNAIKGEAIKRQAREYLKGKRAHDKVDRRPTV